MPEAAEAEEADKEVPFSAVASIISASTCAGWTKLTGAAGGPGSGISRSKRCAVVRAQGDARGCARMTSCWGKGRQGEDGLHQNVRLQHAARPTPFVP